MIDVILPLGRGDEEYLHGEWVECWQCDATGVSGHDCGDDTCLCFAPEDNIVCDECGGKGGWHHVEPEDEANGTA